MRRLNIAEIGEKLDKWLRGAAPRREAVPPPPPEEAQDAQASGEDGLYAALCGVPSDEAGDGRTLVLCREMDEGRGEDSCLAVRDGERLFLGAFDGCGGSGAKVYPAFGGHTGAWAASRAATLAARDWFLDGAPEEELAGCIDRALKDLKSREPGGQLLMGSLSREFPTTVAAFTLAADGGEATLYWCGDSRCYLLDADGLHQATADDSSIQDAMRNLREDAPMTNVACASRPFELHSAHLVLQKPALLLAATDGCFGYLPSPMAFERLLLRTLARSNGMRDWRRRLDARIGEVSGDDYTLVAWIHGFSGFKEMKRALKGRLAVLERDFPEAESEEILLSQWDAYREDYERAMAGGAVE